MLRIVKIFIFGLCISILILGCKSSQVRQIEKKNRVVEDNQQKELLQLREMERGIEQEDEKALDQYYKDAQKRHLKQQSGTTLNSMKYNKKRSKKINKQRKRGFFERLFNPGCR